MAATSTSGRRLTGAVRRPGVDSLFVSASLLAAAASGAGIALALTLASDNREATDAVLAAYSLYGIAALLVADGRTALVPLFGPAETDEDFVPRARMAASRTAMTATLAAIAMAALSPLVGPLITGALSSSAQHKATYALLLLAPSILLQGRAAVCSAVLNAVGRVRVSAIAYIAAGAVSIGVAVPLVLGLGGLGAPLAILLGSLMLAGVHELYLRGFGFKLRVRPSLLRERAQWQLVSSVLSIALVGLTMQFQFAISLRSLPGESGTITAYVYAFSLIMALLAVTSISASTVALPDLVRRMQREHPEQEAADYVVRLSTVSLAAMVPLLAAAAAFGLPLFEAILSDALTSDRVRVLYHLVLVFIPMGLLFVVTAIATPVVLARGRERLMVLMAVVVLGGQLVADLIVHDHALAVGIAQCVAGGVLTVMVVGAATGRLAAQTFAKVAVGSAPAFLLCLPFLIGIVVGGGASFFVALAAAIACLAVYAIAGVLLWPSVLGSLPGLSGLRARIAPS